MTDMVSLTKEDVDSRIRAKMERRQIADEVIRGFLKNVDRMRGQASHIALDEVSAPDLDRILDFGPSPNSEDLAELEDRGRSLLNRVVVLKLNGGRSTTMGGRVPKGILEVKYGRSYLEIIINQVEAVRKRFQTDIPLILMNSFFTHTPTMDIVRRNGSEVLTFLQGEVPRLLDETLEPLESGTEEDWAPPGHGDVYESIRRSGLLDKLLRQGKRWAFISNLDNLAAYVDPWIVGAIDKHDIDFLLEVTDRTPADRKGGTLVMRNGRLDLLEIAQVAPRERTGFMDIGRFKVFNTNNVWVDLEALKDALDAGSLELPLIQNRKIIDGAPVVQLETAMGAAIGAFPRSKGLRVGRDRFFPTKKVSDLFVLQSDVCVLDSMRRLRRSANRSRELPFLPSVTFEPDFLDSADMIYSRFQDPSSVSLLAAESLEVAGPVFFERNVKIVGSVRIQASPEKELRVPADSVLTDGEYGPAGKSFD